MSAVPSSWVKRKPPPSFPYSQQFPEPDPEDPFLPLSELRARAKASTSTLVNPSVESHEAYYSGAEGRRAHFTLTPDRAATDVEPQSRRHGLVGYLSDVSKPLRPPKSWKRPGTRETTYFSDDERGNRFTQAFLYPKQQRTVATPEATPKERRVSVHHTQDPQYHYRRRSQSVGILQDTRAGTGELRPNTSESAQDALSYGDRQSHGYAYNDLDDHRRHTSRESSRSRSRSASSNHSLAPSTRLSEHGVAHRQSTPPMTPDDSLSTASASPLSDRFIAHNMSISAQVALHDLLDDPPPVPVPKDNLVIRSNRDTIVAFESNHVTVVADPSLAGRRSTILFDTVVASPTSSESSLQPEIPDMEPEPDEEPAENVDAQPSEPDTDGELPGSNSPVSSGPPSPSRGEAPLPPPPARPSVSHVESDPETNTHTLKRKRSRVRKFSEFREGMKQKSKTNSSAYRTTVSNSIRAKSAARKSVSITASVYPVSSTHSITSPEVVPISPPTIPCVREPPERESDGTGAFSDTEIANRKAHLGAPRPRKSLSHVNLGLRVLPNASLAPTIAPSANTSNASAVGNLSIVKSKEEGAENRTMDLLRAQTVPPVPRMEPLPPVPRRAQTEIPHIGQHNMLQLNQLAPSGSESAEDLATYSVYTQFIVPLSPILPLASSTPAGTAYIEVVDDRHPPRVSSPVPIDEDHEGLLTAPQPTRRAMPLPAAPRRDSADKSHRTSTIPPPPPVRSESPVTRAKSPELRAAIQKVEVTHEKLTRHYQAPTPLPLSPPTRAKSPISAQLHGQQYDSENEAHELAPVVPRAISPVPVPIKAKAVQDILQMSYSKDDERSSQRSRGSRGSRDREDTGYLPVAQLPTRPTASRQQTAQSQSSSRRSTVSKAHSAQVATPVYPHTAQARADTQAKPRAQSPTHAPPRVRSPEPVRALTKVRTMQKDLDSPLPPPPVEVRPLPADPTPRSASAPNPRTSSATMRTPAVPRRAATTPEVTSPIIFVTPPPLSPTLPHHQNTEPRDPVTDIELTPAWTTHSHPDYLYEHGRSCTPHQTHTASTHRNPPDFDAAAVPTMEQLGRAATLDVIAQNGLRVPFGDLFRDRKVVVIFIRHFWCPLCQDYMHSISRSVEIETLKRAGVALVVIGNGSPAMIKSYRHIFRTPFALYTDPNLRVYNALGMTRRTTDPGPDHEKGDYVRHGLIGGIAMVVRNALKVGVPVWERGGEIAQLGGEFVLGPGMVCSYAHRMKTTRDHAPITTVLAAAGVPRRPVNVQEMEDEQWPASRYASTSHKRTLTKAQKPVDCVEYCEVEEVPYDSSHHGYRANSRMGWDQASVPADVPRREDGEDMGAEADADTEEDRIKVHRRQQMHSRTRQNNLKKGVRNYRVTNPDRKRSVISRAPSSNYDKHELWRPPTSASLDEFGTRKRDYDPAYTLTHEVLSYTFGNERI